MLKLDTQIDLSAFWSWWTGELLSLLPNSIADSFYNSQGWLIIEPIATGLKLSYQSRLESISLGEFDDSANAKQRLKILRERQEKLTNAEVLIRIPEAMGMRKFISLPEAAAANVQQVLGYELDRYTPFKAEQVYFDVLRQGKPLNGQLKLSLLLVQRAVLDKLTDQVTALGLEPAYADFALEPLPPLASKERYNLLPLALRHIRSQKPRLIMLASAALTMCLLVTTLCLPLWMAYQGIDKLKSHAKIVEKQALKIEESKRGIDYLYTATNKLIDKKNQAPMLLDTINFISKVLKDDTYVSQLKYSNGNLELLGESANASDILAILEKTKRFKNARFISPVTQDQTSGKERFQLSTEIIPAAADVSKTQ